MTKKSWREYAARRDLEHSRQLANHLAVWMGICLSIPIIAFLISLLIKA